MSDDKQINHARKEGGFPEGGKKYPNPPERTIPDASTIRDQWKYAMRQYSKWYSHAWGTAILAGLSFFALGWVIKGENPIPSFHSNHNKPNPKQDDEAPSAPPPPPPTVVVAPP